MILAFPLLVFLILLGSSGASLWFAACGAMALTVLALVSELNTLTKLLDQGHTRLLLSSVALSFAYSFVTSASAILLGQLAVLLV